MIKEGRKGSFNLYWKGTLVSSFPWNNIEDLAKLYFLGEKLILDTIKSKGTKHHSIKDQISYYVTFCNLIEKRKRENKPIHASSHTMFLAAVMALIKLKIIDEDDDNSGYLICKKKKKNTCLLRYDYLLKLNQDHIPERADPQISSLSG